MTEQEQASIQNRSDALKAIVDHEWYVVIAMNSGIDPVVSLQTNIGRRAVEFMREAADKLEQQLDAKTQ